MPNNDGDMDENELAIAQILAEEAKALDNNVNGANANNFNNSNNYNDFNGSSMAGSNNNNPIPNDGVRAPDEARFAVLSGPDPYDDDYDPEFERQVQREQRRME